MKSLIINLKSLQSSPSISSIIYPLYTIVPGQPRRKEIQGLFMRIDNSYSIMRETQLVSMKV